MNYLILISLIVILVGFFILVFGYIFDKNETLKLKKHKNDKYAILIPARDESKVIGKLLESIKIQNKDMSNVYIIVEEKEDSTCEIAKEYGANIFIREKPIRPRKGYALDECLKEILKTKHYDLYFILDADNILDKNFIKTMLKSWHEGYDVAAGYRNILNPTNAISGCSILLFSLINSIINKLKMRNNKTIILCGTGLYISGKIIEKLNGFPFNTLTEDYEMSLYFAANNVSSIYNDKAIFYDEQPTKMKVSIKQRVRWTKGILDTRKKMLKSLKNNFSSKMSIIALLLIVFGAITLFILTIINCFISNKFYGVFVLVPTILYIILFLLTLILLVVERKNLNLSKKLKIKCLFFNPIFLSTYVYCYFKALLSKNIGWDKIKHNGI